MKSEDNRNAGAHIIGHADSNNDIAQNPPSIPYLRGDVNRWLGTNLQGSCSYDNGSVFDDPHFGSVKQGVTILLFTLNPKRYPATKLDERELCNIFPMFMIRCWMKSENHLR